jgi:hypothetical protein
MCSGQLCALLGFEEGWETRDILRGLECRRHTGQVE